MSETTPRRVLHLVIDGFDAAQVPSPHPADATEVFPLTEANAREALEKIFAADTVAVWGPL